MLLMLLLLIRINSCCCWKADNLAGLVRQHVLLDLPHHHQPGQHLLQREPDGVVECYLSWLVVILLQYKAGTISFYSMPSIRCVVMATLFIKALLIKAFMPKRHRRSIFLDLSSVCMAVSVHLLKSWVENQTGESGTQLLSGWR